MILYIIVGVFMVGELELMGDNWGWKEGRGL